MPQERENRKKKKEDDKISQDQERKRASPVGASVRCNRGKRNGKGYTLLPHRVMHEKGLPQYGKEKKDLRNGRGGAP